MNSTSTSDQNLESTMNGLNPMAATPPAIMVVEDDQDILDALTAILLTKGYQVQAVDRADQVISSVIRQNPNLILLDIWVGGGDGRDLFKELRQHPVSQDIPVIFVSANMSTPQIAKDLQVDDFIMKPFDVDYLLNVVEKHLKLGAEKNPTKNGKQKLGETLISDENVNGRQ